MPRKIVTRRSAIHGNGMFAVAPIAKGERLIEYKGRRRTHEDVDAGDSGDVDSGHTFLFTLNDEYVIDANHEGNGARWINHSCAPNCEAVLDENEADRRKARVFIEADPRHQAGRGADLRLRHHPGGKAHRAAEEGLGLPLRLEKVHRNHAQAEEALSSERVRDAGCANRGKGCNDFCQSDVAGRRR